MLLLRIVLFFILYGIIGSLIGISLIAFIFSNFEEGHKKKKIKLSTIIRVLLISFVIFGSLYLSIPIRENNYCKQEGGYLSDLPVLDDGFECTFNDGMSKIYYSQVKKHCEKQCLKWDKWGHCIKKSKNKCKYVLQAVGGNNETR